jgi:hypothetical protein
MRRKLSLLHTLSLCLAMNLIPLFVLIIVHFQIREELLARGMFTIIFYMWVFIVISAILTVNWCQGFLARVIPYSNKLGFLRSMSLRNSIVATLIFCLTCYGHFQAKTLAMTSYTSVLSDDHSRIERFYHEHIQRFKIMEEAKAKNLNKATIPLLSDRAPLLLYWDIEDADKFGFAGTYAKFFGLDEVIVARKTISKNK